MNKKAKGYSGVMDNDGTQHDWAPDSTSKTLCGEPCEDTWIAIQVVVGATDDTNCGACLQERHAT